MNTNMNTTRPTPETDAVAWVVAFGYQHLNEDVDVVDAEFARQRERERDEAHEQLKAMREVIEDVNKILLSIQRNDIFEETMRNHATCALAKLQPFIKP
jgi:hypothetical protein